MEQIIDDVFFFSLDVLIPFRPECYNRCLTSCYCITVYCSILRKVTDKNGVRHKKLHACFIMSKIFFKNGGKVMHNAQWTFIKKRKSYLRPQTWWDCPVGHTSKLGREEQKRKRKETQLKESSKKQQQQQSTHSYKHASNIYLNDLTHMLTQFKLCQWML